MHITEVVIDGFKSYAVRTVISGWDASFNAITGLNGSGKSNILDAICFCLGIAKYDLLRASAGAQDLIYKRGQAGVTKASVTLIFDNNDHDENGKKRLCPIGFEDYGTISVTRQVILGGTSKYLINGHRAQQQTVQNLFQSVQLNINNPNFLIMQGRVTKVLNMKSTEILAMIEEAAGTRMFEDRREKALRTMSKKQAKVVELEELLRDEIEPKLEKLRGEKRAFLEFQSAQNDSERLARLVILFDYRKSKRRLETVKGEIQVRQRTMTELTSTTKRLDGEISILEEDLTRLRAQREQGSRANGALAELEELVKNRSHDIVRLSTLLDLKRTSLQDEETRQLRLHQSLHDTREALGSKRNAILHVQQDFESAAKQLAAEKAELEIKEELVQTLQTGISTSASRDGGYSGQLTLVREKINGANIVIEQSKLKIEHLEKRLVEDKSSAKKAQEENALLRLTLEKLREDAAHLADEVTNSGMAIKEAEQAELTRAQLATTIKSLRQSIEDLARTVAGLEFDYDFAPESQYDSLERSKVKGVVARLFDVPIANGHASTALEICAGARLYNVVVDTSSTGTAILEHGKLKRRVTIIPLDKIVARCASNDQIAVAQRRAPEKVQLALTLIEYEKDVKRAMEYVFGNTLIAADAQVAKAVTFDQSVRLKSVTIDGDVYDPSGTLSGGSAAHGVGILQTLGKMKEMHAELAHHVSRMSALETQISEQASRLLATKHIQQQLDLKLHEIELAEQQLASNSNSSIIAKAQQSLATIVNLKAEIERAELDKANAHKEMCRVEKDMRDFSMNKAGKLDELIRELDKLKVEYAKTQLDSKPLQHLLREARTDIEQLEADLSTVQHELQESQSAISIQQIELAKIQHNHDMAIEQHSEALEKLEGERKLLRSFDAEMNELEEARKKKTQMRSDCNLELQSLDHSADTLHKSQVSIEQSIVAMEAGHGWLTKECRVSDTNDQFDGINDQNIKARRVELKTLQDRTQGLRRKINPAVMAMIDSVEKKERDLKNMMRTVAKDKHKIEETISSLDDYKKEALHKTWVKVNRDFGHIFNDLLPGNSARLDPIEGKAISDGLEVKVCLGNVWKQSLTELSGGQRSLIALSLILSLLQYSPAPMYILDEVDAALDLSHTQNIGRLIKTRFRNAQFIVVSLKDGMFTNANRIFRTRFMDGTSIVQTMTASDVR